MSTPCRPRPRSRTPRPVGFWRRRACCSEAWRGRRCSTGSTAAAPYADAVAALDPEDEKLLTLARSARARAGADQGAAVRDDIGRTYAAASVSLPSLRLSALQAVIAAAVSSG